MTQEQGIVQAVHCPFSSAPKTGCTMQMPFLAGLMPRRWIDVAPGDGAKVVRGGANDPLPTLNERRRTGILAFAPDLPALLPTFGPVIHAILPALDACRSIVLRAAGN